MAAHRFAILLAAALLWGCATPDSTLPPEAAEPTVDERGYAVGQYGDHHVIYVPTYSHVYHSGTSPRRFQLTTTLSVHNISFRDSVRVHKVRYYGTEGRLVKDVLKQTVVLRPMQTYKVRIAPQDTTGAGAGFLVEWEGAPRVPPPIVEAVHIGVSSTAGLSFVTRGTQLAPSVVPDAIR